MSAVVVFDNVCKRYRVGASSSLRSALASFPRALLNGHRLQDGEQELWALRDAGFELHPGEIVGVIGPNGAGKTTMLKLISRITFPTSGTVTVNGRVSSLIELGAGFHPDLTGRENVYLNGSILGMRKKEIDHLFDDIIGFAALERFVEMPVKRYSSGMYARLGFAVAAHVNPDVLLVDEVLSVGDASFQRRCHEKISDLVQHEGRTVLIVSHGLTGIRNLCERVIWIDAGRIRKIGDPDETIRAYEGSIFSEPGESPSQVEQPEANNVQIIGISLLGQNGEPKDVFDPLDYLTTRVTYQVRTSLPRGLAFSIGVVREDTLHCYTSFSHENGLEFPNGNRAGVIEASYTELRLMPGNYLLYVTAISADERRTIYTYQTAPFQVCSHEPLDIRNGSFYNVPLWNLIDH